MSTKSDAKRKRYSGSSNNVLFLSQMMSGLIHIVGESARTIRNKKWHVAFKGICLYIDYIIQLTVLFSLLLPLNCYVNPRREAE